MNALGRMLEAVKPDGLILDLQVIRPNPRAELDGPVVAEIDGEPLFRWADAAAAAIDSRIQAGDSLHLDDNSGHATSIVTIPRAISLSSQAWQQPESST